MSRIECKWGRTKDFAHLHSIRLMWSTTSELGPSCLHCCNLHLVFTNEKCELAILTTKHSLSASYTTWKVCFLTTNKGHNEFPELQIGKFIFWPQIWSEGHLGHLPSYTEDLFSYLNSWPFAISKLQTLFPDDTGFSYLLSRAVGQNTWSFDETYHAYSNLHVTSCTRSWCRRAGGRSVKKFSIQTGLGLRYTTWTANYGKQES